VAASQKYDIVNRAAIRVKELDDFPFIALSEVHCLGEQVQSFCYQQDIDFNIVCHTAQLSTVQKCIALGLRVSLVPLALAINVPLDQIMYCTISDSVPQRNLSWSKYVRYRNLLTFESHQCSHNNQQVHKNRKEPVTRSLFFVSKFDLRRLDCSVTISISP